MQRRSFVTVMASLVGTVSGYLLGRRPARAQGSGMMGGGMMGSGMGGMMSPENMRGPMRTGMELFERHKLIRRQVTDLPDGVHDVTTSADPATAALIKEHVIDMYRRLDEDRPFPYPMSNSVPQMVERDAHPPASSSTRRDERRQVRANSESVRKRLLVRSRRAGRFSFAPLSCTRWCSVVLVLAGFEEFNGNQGGPKRALFRDVAPT